MERQIVTITTPDGVERELRFTLGARKRITRDLGRPFAEVMGSLSDEDLPTLIYNCLFDGDGSPPEGLTIKKLEEGYTPEDAKELLASMFSAMTHGAIKKNESLEMIERAQEAQIQSLIQKNTGTTYGPTPDNILESPVLPRPGKRLPGSSGTSRKPSLRRSVAPMKSDAPSLDRTRP